MHSSSPSRIAIAVACGCGLSHTLPASWLALPFVGLQDDGDGGHLELRNCPCGSTLTREVPAPVPSAGECMPTETQLPRPARLGFWAGACMATVSS
jgi:hypothetical protein